MLTLEQLMSFERHLRYAASSPRLSPEKRKHCEDGQAVVAEVYRLWKERQHLPMVSENDERIRAAITEFAAAIVGRKS